jgi:hypothetical protein
MKKFIFVILSAVVPAVMLLAAEKTAPVSVTPSSAAANAAISATITAGVEQATPISLTHAAEAAVPVTITSTLEKAGPSALTTAAGAEASGNTMEPSAMEGIAPPSADTGSYEKPDEPEPTTEEAGNEKNIFRENRKLKHYTIELTAFTPSAIGTKLGYFINENWKVSGEYSSIAALAARATNERNDSYAVNICFSPAETEWSPFYGVGFTRQDMVVNANASVTNDRLHVKRDIVGGYITAGMNWITDSILTFSVEFDLLGGYLREDNIDITNPAATSTVNQPNIWANFGFTAGICF